MNPDKVLSLQTHKNIDIDAVGPKAMSLIRMSRIGLPVPTGFCITAASYREHLKKNNLSPLIKSTIDKCGITPEEDRMVLLSVLRKAIIKTPLGGFLLKEIDKHYHALGAGHVAVRSSATSEDLPGHSFAGQYDTYLGVFGHQDCIEAIKKCWASLWTERAYDYREKNSLDHISINMAVIVQSLVHADASGVLFTLDPVTGRSDRLIIEACFGLGDVLVSGKITPDRFALAKKNLRILSHTVSEKGTEHIVSEKGRIYERAVVDERANTPCIDSSTVRRLAKFARKNETAFGSPLDIEWAVKGKDIFFLQARPITTIPETRSIAQRQVWTNLNLGEILPDVATPISRSIADRFAMAIFSSFFGWVGLDFSDNPLVGEIAGRLYFNLNTFISAVRHFPGLNEKDLTKALGGEQEKMRDIGQLEIPDEDIPDLSFSLLGMILRVPSLFFRIFNYLPKKGDKFIAHMRKKIDKLQKIDISSLSEPKLVSHLRYAFQDVLNNTHAIGFSLLGMTFFSILDKISRKWLDDSKGTFTNRLLVGMGDMDSAEAGFDLWRLAVKAQKNRVIKESILSGDNWRAIRKRIGKVQDADNFLSSWDEFIAKHGHHTRAELELFNPRWSETPDYILNMLRGYIRSSGKTDPVKNQRSLARERNELARQCRQHLRNPFKRVIFNLCLEQAQAGSIIRENIKSVAVRYWMVMRFTVLELGKRLTIRGVLKNRDDIFFLSIEEIGPVSRNEADFKVKDVIATRRNEYERNLTITPPKVVVGRFDPDNFIPDKVDKTATVLTGLAVSPGVVTGKARVILRANTDEQVLPGEILVAPFTDPGWTPYFLTAAAIVMDQGGILSHGSIVAREYGIPTVVNVGPATKIIKTGQTIQVDANRGIVKLLSNKSNQWNN